MGAELINNFPLNSCQEIFKLVIREERPQRLVVENTTIGDRKSRTDDVFYERGALFFGQKFLLMQFRQQSIFGGVRHERFWAEIQNIRHLVYHQPQERDVAALTEKITYAVVNGMDEQTI